MMVTSDEGSESTDIAFAIRIAKSKVVAMLRHRATRFDLHSAGFLKEAALMTHIISSVNASGSSRMGGVLFSCPNHLS